MVDTSFAGKFLFTQTTAMAKHGGKTYAGGSREKYTVPTILIFTYQQHLYSPKKNGFDGIKMILSVFFSNVNMAKFPQEVCPTAP